MFRSTRPQGARLNRRMKTGAIRSFRSTRPQGARLPVFLMDVYAKGVSIHAPAGGATIGRISVGIIGIRFDPRARRGRDGPPDNSFSRRAKRLRKRERACALWSGAACDLGET